MKNNLFSNEFSFIHEPIEFNKFTDMETLKYCLGGTLYMPGTKDIKEKILTKQIVDMNSMVMCFEDAIQEKDISKAEDNVIDTLKSLSESILNKKLTYDDIPLIFIRVRNTDQFKSFSKKLNNNLANVLTGFVFPKFYSFNGDDYFNHLQQLNQKLEVRLYGMPILEGKAIAHIETRMSELQKLKKILDPYRELVLNIRVGGTDFSSIFGVRRGINYSIYDIYTVRDCLTDILNFFSRDDENYVVSGPVWEYFLAYKQDDINILLEENIHRSLLNGNKIINEAIDGLLREVILDKANGFVGKTIIHPSHLRFVNAMQAVTKEEYDDAMQILNTVGGVVRSQNSNKMNEINPHRNWANKIIQRAKAYGVVENENSFLQLALG